MKESFYIAAIPVVLFAMAHKAIQFSRNRRNPGLFAARMAMFVAALSALSVAHSSAYTWLGETTGIPNLAQLVKNLSAVIGLACIAYFFRNLNEPTTVRRRTLQHTAVTAPIVAVMVTAFAVAPTPQAAADDYLSRYGHLPAVGVYYLCYVAALSVNFVALTGIALRYWRHAPRRAVRISAALMAIGYGCGIVYTLLKAHNIAVVAFTVRSPLPTDDTGTSIAMGIAIILVTIGGTIPGVGPAARSLARWPRRVTALRALRPLWADVARAAPSVILTPSTPIPTPRTAGPLLLRRVVEIRDGALETRTHLAPGTTNEARSYFRARGFSGDHLDAAVEAACLRIALRTPQPVTDDPDPHPLSSIGGDDVDDDAARLVPVARAYTTAPVILFAAEHTMPQLQEGP